MLSRISRISRLPLRRCLHTGAAANSSSFDRTTRIIVGVSSFSAAYLAWRLRESRHIALDSPSSHITDSDSDTPSGDAKNKNNIDGEGIDGEGVDGEGVDGEGVDGEGSSSEGAPASGGAFNPETGEINWDCPCLGGMAHGPCGPEFREAFSCFVYSEAEPKGINCVEKFQNMQTCFRAHPEIYADEIANDDDDDDEEQPPHPESPNTDKVDHDATPELNSPSKPPLEGEVPSQNEV